MSNHFHGTNTGFLVQTSSRLERVELDASGDGAGVHITGPAGGSPEPEDYPFSKIEQLITRLRDELAAIDRRTTEYGSTEALTGKAEGIELAIAVALRLS